MKVSPARGVAAVGCALLFCAGAAAQPSSWSAVRGIAMGTPVEARLVNGAKVTGKFVAAYAAGVELRTSPDTTRYVPRAGIRKLYLAGKSAAARDAWIGVVVGATTGAIYGVAKANCQTGPGGNGSPNCQSIQGRSAAEWGAVFGLVGAVAGGGAGEARGHGILLYWRSPGGGRRGRKAPAQGAPRAKAAPAGPAGRGMLAGAGGASRLAAGARSSPATKRARTPRNAWAAVRGLAAGSRVKMRLASGAKVKGKIVSVSAAGLDLRTRHTIRYIRRARIRTLALSGM